MIYDSSPTAFRRRNLFATLPIVALVLILATAGVLLFGALRSVGPWSLDLGPSSDEHFVAGFFGAERDGPTSFRWSRPESQITLYGAAGRRLNLRLYGSGTAQAGDGELRLSTNGEPVGAFVVDGGWRVYRVLLPPNSVDGAIPLDLTSAAHSSSPDDPRELGAASVDWVEVAPLNAGFDGWWPALVRTLLLVWTLALLAVALALAHQALVPQTPFLPAWVVLLSGVASAVLVGWAWYDPYTLALAVPTPPVWLLLVATVVTMLLKRMKRTMEAGRSDAGGEADKPISQQTLRLVSRVSSLVSLALALLLHLLIFLPLPIGLRGSGALLLLGVPGALIALQWFEREDDLLIKGFLALCGALTLQQLLIFALQALPGPLRWWQLLLANDLILALLICQQLTVGGWRSNGAFSGPRSLVPRLAPHLPLMFVLLLAAFLRFPHLGSAEFQADEIRPMYLAAGLLHGQDGILLLHRKGPVEVLLPAGPLVLLEGTNEFVARLPFALAGMGIVLGAYLLSRSLLGGRVGIAVGVVAGSIIAVDGFLLAFSRIVQYQSIVVLMGLAAVWCAWQFYAGAGQRYLVGAAVFSALSMLAHYDGIFAVPTLAFLAIAGCYRRGWSLRQSLAGLWPSAAVGLILLLSFYGPFFFSERFERTTAYLGRRLAEQPAFVATTGGPPFNNLPTYYNSFTFYNSTFQMQWYAIILALAFVVWLGWYLRPPMLGVLLAALFAVGCVLLVFAPEWLLLPGGGSLAVVPFTLAFGALVFAPGTPRALRLLLIWFAPPFLAESFVIAKPDTHFYTIHLPAALLIAYGLMSAVRWLRARPVRPLVGPLLAGHAVVLLLALPYLNLLFVRQMPEYVSLFPALRPALYQASYGDKRPAGGTFGFPNRSGWKAIGALYASGELHGDFESNGMKQIVGWYTRDVFRCYDQPAYYFVDRMPKNPVKIPIDFIHNAYHLFGYVLVDGVRMIDIYSKAPVDAPPRVFDQADYLGAFDRQAVTDFPTSRLLTNEIVPQHHLVANWQQGITLRGYDLDHHTLAPGEEAVMSFYWQAAGPIAPGYAPAVEIVDNGGQVVGNGSSYCGGDPPEEWYTQYVNDIAFKVTPNDRMPPGEYSLRVGLRHQQTGDWLPLAAGGVAVPFAQISVVAPNPR